MEYLGFIQSQLIPQSFIQFNDAELLMIVAKFVNDFKIAEIMYYII